MQRAGRCLARYPKGKTVARWKQDREWLETSAEALSEFLRGDRDSELGQVGALIAMDAISDIGLIASFFKKK